MRTKLEKNFTHRLRDFHLHALDFHHHHIFLSRSSSQTQGTTSITISESDPEMFILLSNRFDSKIVGFFARPLDMNLHELLSHHFHRMI